MKSFSIIIATLLGIILFTSYKVLSMQQAMLISGAFTLMCISALILIKLRIYKKSTNLSNKNYKKNILLSILPYLIVFSFLFYLATLYFKYTPPLINKYLSTSQTQQQDTNDSENKRPDTNHKNKKQLPQHPRNDLNYWTMETEMQVTVPNTKFQQAPDFPQAYLQFHKHYTPRNRLYLNSYPLEKLEHDIWSVNTVTHIQHIAGEDGWIDLSEQVIGRQQFPTLRYFISHHPSHRLMLSLSGPERVKLASVLEIASNRYILEKTTPSEKYVKYQGSAKQITISQITNPKIPTTFSQHLTEHTYNTSLAHLFAEQQVQLSALPQLKDKVRAIRQFLKDNYSYSLTINDSEDGLSEFLLKEKKGSCIHFSTSAAHLLRAQGIPCRIMIGWSGGKFFPDRNLQVFYGKDYHAWLEILLEDYGWVIFDSTPSSHELDALPREATHGETPAELTTLKETIERELEKAIDSSPNSSSVSSHNYQNFYLLLIPLSLGVIYLIIRAIPKVTPSSYTSQTQQHTKPKYQKLFLLTAQSKGFDITNSMTMKEQIAFLKNQEAHTPFMDDMLRYHYSISYNFQRPNTSTEKEFIRAIKAW